MPMKLVMPIPIMMPIPDHLVLPWHPCRHNASGKLSSIHSLKQKLLTLDLSIKIKHHLYHQHEAEEEEQIAGQCSLVPFPMSARLSLRTSSYLTVSSVTRD